MRFERKILSLFVKHSMSLIEICAELTRFIQDMFKFIWRYYL